MTQFKLDRKILIHKAWWFEYAVTSAGETLDSIHIISANHHNDSFWIGDKCIYITFWKVEGLGLENTVEVLIRFLNECDFPLEAQKALREVLTLEQIRSIRNQAQRALQAARRSWQQKE